MNFDATIHLGDLLVGAGGVFAFLKVFLGLRDSNNKLTVIVKDHERRITQVEGVSGDNRDAILRAGIDRIFPHRDE